MIHESQINITFMDIRNSFFITFRMSRSRSRSRSRSYSPSRPQSKENGGTKTEHKEVLYNIVYITHRTICNDRL